MLINNALPNQNLNLYDLNQLMQNQNLLQAQTNSNLVQTQQTCLPQQNMESLLFGLLERVISSFLSLFDRIFTGEVNQLAKISESNSGLDKILNKGSELVGGVVEKIGNSLFSGISNGISKILGF